MPPPSCALTPTRPATSVLLSNYPNPFNPETWMPFSLRTPSDVTIHIYDLRGSVVRTLDLGRQRAGHHVARSDAAYWDGRDAQGQPVSSGVYFYALHAGERTAIRHMTVRK